MVLHRVILGALSSFPRGGMYAGLEKFAGNKPETYGHEYDLSSFYERLRTYKLIFLGEVHSDPDIIDFQKSVIESLMTKPPPPIIRNLSSSKKTTPSSSSSSSCPYDGNRKKKQPKLHVIMEHFSFDMQHLLDGYCQQKLSFEQLVKEYQKIGTEGHDLRPYKPLLEYIRQCHSHSENNDGCPSSTIQLHAGFLSRKYARQLMKEGPDVTLTAAAPWLPSVTKNAERSLLEGNDFHYRLFESLISGRDIHDTTTRPDDDDGAHPLRRIFPAQILKDVAMAEQIHRVLIQNEQEHDEENGTTADSDDRIVVVAGNGHVAYYQGVPERVLAQHPHLVDRTCVVTSHRIHDDDTNACLLLRRHRSSSAEEEEEERDNRQKLLLDEVNAGPKGANPADFFFLFGREPLDENLSTDDDGHHAKTETKSAYDQVGASAHHEGNLKRAHAILSYLGYTPHEIDVAGADAYNYQGVGNPHKHAKLRAGEHVLDVGSGLGVDSWIALDSVGRQGKVVGVDLSAKQVAFTKRRAQQRKAENVDFVAADMEQLPFENESFDAVISNGAFCLAPNKEKAFAEIWRVLRPGGRMVVCTTTLRHKNLQPGVDWPLCMRMFMPKEDMEPLCQRLGFVDVLVDDSDGTMTYELPEEAMYDESKLNPSRHRVHVGSEEFAHLENYNMDEICVRVCLVAKKPNGAE